MRHRRRTLTRASGISWRIAGQVVSDTWRTIVLRTARRSLSHWRLSADASGPQCRSRPTAGAAAAARATSAAGTLKRKTRRTGGAARSLVPPVCMEPPAPVLPCMEPPAPVLPPNPVTPPVRVDPAVAVSPPLPVTPPLPPLPAVAPRCPNRQRPRCPQPRPSQAPARRTGQCRPVAAAASSHSTRDHRSSQELSRLPGSSLLLSSMSPSRPASVSAHPFLRRICRRYSNTRATRYRRSFRGPIMEASTRLVERARPSRDSGASVPQNSAGAGRGSTLDCE